jgi:cytoskeletal protein CcmA (bactofilin family)
MSLSGAITTNGLTPKIKVYGTSGYQQITSTISSATPGASLELNTNSGSSLIINSNISEFIPFINKTGAGQLNINGQIFGSITSDGGTVTISPNGSIGTTGNIFVNSSLVIESNLSGERQFGSRLSLSGNGPTGASLTIGTPNSNGIVTLTSSIVIVGPSVIRTPNSGATSVNFNGAINASGQNLTIETNSLSEATISSTLVSNRLDKNEGGLLTISGSASANINVNAGTLKVNGNVNGSVTVSAVSKLKGSGTINGSVTNFGTIAPGNSPGVLIINGSYTASPGSFYEAEVAGLGGAGAFNGHDSIVVTGTPGTFSFQNGSGLKAIKLNAFEPAKGNAFRIINATGGISGVFSSFTSQFNQWVLFDKSTGSLYGTGLAAGQTFSAYSPNLGEVIWLNSINAYSNDPTNGYTGTFDSNTVWGNAALSLIRGELLPGSSDGSPFAALGAVVQSELRDSARTSLEALQSRRFERVTTSRTTWEGYLQYSSLKASTTRFETNSNGITAGMLCDVDPISTIGFGITSYDSSTIFSNAYGNSSGRSYSLTMFASTMLDEKSRKTFLDGGVQFGNTTSKTKRTTFLGQQSSNVRADNLGAFMRIGSATMLTDSLSATTYTGLDYVHSNTPSFNEQGDLTSLSVATNTGKSMHAQLGADLNWSFKSGSTSARISLGTEVFFELLDGNTYDISYNYQGAPQSVATGKHYPRTGLRFAPRIEISPGRNSSYYLNISVELNGGSSQSSLNLGYKAKF